VRLLHELGKIHAGFDDPHLVSHAGLVPVMALARQAGHTFHTAPYPKAVSWTAPDVSGTVQSQP